MPIYYVIVKQQHNLKMLNVWQIIKVIEGELSDIDRLYREHVAPLWETGESHTAFIFYREPGNPFRDWPMLDPVNH